MGFINKIKNFFYDEEEVEEEVPKEKVQSEKRKKIDKKEIEEDVSERELFRSERTFNFPMDIEEDDFASKEKSIKEEDVVKNKVMVKPYEYKPLKKEEVRKPYSYVKPKEKEVKKFKPTPVISPVFGILDENYKADEKLVKNSLEETKEFNISRKVTFDEIHKKAFGTPIKQEEKVNEEENNDNSLETKDIFYNLKEDSHDEEDNEDIKITYNDVDYDEEDVSNDEEIVVPKISRIKKNIENEESTDEDILSETKEQDLFNLIDNMYNSDDEEEEDE